MKDLIVSLVTVGIIAYMIYAGIVLLWVYTRKDHDHYENNI